MKIRILTFAYLFSLSGLTVAQRGLSSDTLLLGEVEIRESAGSVFPVNHLFLPDTGQEPLRDLGDLLRESPNVAGVRKGGIAIDPVVRGFIYDQVSVILNGGIRIEGGCPNRMDPVSSRVEHDQLEAIGIMRGPWVLRYGPVPGAVINLITRMPVPRLRPGIEASASYGFETNWNGQRESIRLSGGNHRLFFTAGGGYAGYGSYRAGDGRLFNSSFRKIYGSGGLGWAISNNHVIRANYRFNQGENTVFPALPMDEKLDRTHVVSIDYHGINEKKTVREIEAAAYGAWVYHVMDNHRRAAAATMQAETAVDALSAGGRASATMHAGRGTIAAGFDLAHAKKTGDKVMTMKMIMSGDTFFSVKRATVWKEARTLNAGIFGEYTLPLRALDLSAALRLDLNRAQSGDTFRLVSHGLEYYGDPQSLFLNFSFSLGIKTRPASWLTLRASLGKGARSPSLLERYIRLLPVRYDSYDYLGNPRLRPEHNYQADVSAEVTLPETGTFSAAGFFSVVSDYIIGKLIPPSVIRPATQGAPGVKQFTNTDKVLLRGFEVTYRSPRKKRWELTTAAAATWGSIPETVQYIVSQGQVTGEETVKNDPLPEIPPLEGTLRFGWRFFGDRFIPRFTLRAVAPQYRISKAFAEKRTPGFATAAVSVAWSPWRFLQMNVAVSNLFDTPYYEHLNRRMVGSEDRLFEPGRVFQFGVSLHFD